MPRYEVVCSECSYEGDILCSFADVQVQKCPECNAFTVLRMSMATVRGNHTPIHHGHTPMHEDKGFKEELKSIYKDDPLGVPGGDVDDE